MTTPSEGSSSTPLLTTAEDGHPEKQKTSVLKHVFLGIVISLPSIAPGMCLGYSAVTLPQLNYNLDDSTWFVSIIALAIPVGAILSNYIMSRFGLRMALLSVNVVGLLGWLMLSFQPTAPTLAKLYTGRVLTGISIGLASAPASIYASECLVVGDCALKQAFKTWSTVALTLGILLVYVSGSLIPYYQVAGVASIISVITFIAVVVFVPETPSWLRKKGREGDAEWVEKKYGIPNETTDVNKPSSSTKPTEPETPAAGESQKGFNTRLKETLNELEKPEAYKPLAIMIAFFFFQQFSGVHVTIMYLTDVVRSAGIVAINPYFVTVICGAIMLFVSIYASFIYPKTGVKPIATISGAGMAASMLFLAIYLTLRPYFLTSSEYYYLRWIPLVALLINVTSSTFGFLILPWTMLRDVFPLNVKGVAESVAISFGFIFCFIATKSFPYLWLEFGNGGVFYLYGIVALIGTAFVHFYLPETNGKTLNDILKPFLKETS